MSISSWGSAWSGELIELSEQEAGSVPGCADCDSLGGELEETDL